MTNVQKITVEKLPNGMHGVFTYANRNGKEIRACTDTGTCLKTLNKIATSNAKRLKTTVITA